jgi:hypothetical protein
MSNTAINPGSYWSDLRRDYGMISYNNKWLSWGKKWIANGKFAAFRLRNTARWPASRQDHEMG